MKNRYDKHISLYIITTLLFLHFYAYRIWLFSASFLTHGDWYLSSYEHSSELLTLPSIWSSYTNGMVNLTPPFYMFLLIEGFLSHLGVNYPFIERILFMWPIALLTLPLSYILIKSITKDSIASLIGAMIYSYNTYFIIIQTGHLTLMMGYTLAPLALLLFIKTIENNKFINSVLTSITLFIISIYEFRSFILVAMVCVLYSLYYLFFIKNKIFNILSLFTIFKIIFIFAVVLLLNIYWILPLLMITKNDYSPLINRGLFGDDFFNLIRSFTLFHPFWTGGRYFPFIVQKIPFYFYFMPLIAFTGLLLFRKNKKIIFFGSISLMGIFLTKQSNPPFSDVYLFLYNKMPGFTLFREASKFYFLIALGYSVLVSSFIQWFLTNFKVKIRNNLIFNFILVSIFILTIINLRPLISGQIGTLFSERKMPDDYKKFNSFINKQNTYFQTVWVPTDSRWASYTDLNPKIPLAVALSGSWMSFLKNQNDNYNSPSYVHFLKNKETDILFDIASVKYIVLPIQDKLNDDDFFPNYGKRNLYELEINKLSYLDKIDIGTKELDVYLNKNIKPKIYSTTKIERLSDSVPYKAVNFRRVNNTTYKVLITSKLNEYLNFSENYHPDWKLYPGDVNWTNIVLNSVKAYPNSFHTKNAALFNTYLLNVEQLCQLSKCISLGDGNYKVELTLLFKPQAYMYLGSIISAITFIILLSYILFYIMNRSVKKLLFFT